MLDPDVQATIDKRIQRDYKVLLVMSGVVIILLVAFFSFILVRIDQNQKRTQAYIKCVATTLTKPLSERSEQALDSCTTNADYRTKEAD